MSIHPREGAPQPEEIVPLLVVGFREKDYLSLRQLLDRSNWKVEEASSCGEARARLRQRTVPVVISERDLPDGDWRVLLEELAALVNPPRLIVSSHLADERLWAEVLSLGGYDLLLTPLESSEVLRVCYLAWLSWERAGNPAVAPPKAPGLASGSSQARGVLRVAGSGG